MNEVNNGGTVTFLFSILSILSEDLDLPTPLVPAGQQQQQTASPSFSDSRSSQPSSSGVDQFPSKILMRGFDVSPDNFERPPDSSSFTDTPVTPLTPSRQYQEINQSQITPSASSVNFPKSGSVISGADSMTSTGSTTTSVTGEPTPRTSPIPPEVSESTGSTAPTLSKLADITSEIENAEKP